MLNFINYFETMKRKIYLQISGGLGNQLFQYAFAKNLSIKLNANLIIDDKIGFLLDQKFKRKKLLPKNFQYKKINYFELLQFNLIILIKKIFFKKNKFLSFTNSILFDETKTKNFEKNLEKKFLKKKNIYLIGFFQSEKYFFENKKKITEMILYNKNKNIKYFKREINKRSILVGLRLYEEAPKNIKNNFGGIERKIFYKNSLKKLEKLICKPSIFFTSTFQDLKKLKNIIYPNAKILNIFFKRRLNEIEYLILMSNFKNFVISNSSYYWWAAYLAESKRKINIISSDKFNNLDTIPTRWKNININ